MTGNSARVTRIAAIGMMPLPLLFAQPALAQSSPPPASVAPQDASGPVGDQVVDTAAGDDIVVTGSRAARNGAQAPTPVTILDADRLAKLAVTNVGEGLLQLPQFRNITSPTFAVAGNPPGQRLADLRGMGATRTLVLFDGRRFTPTTSQSTVDLNLVPSLLAQRTEVVTGGASAAYGADAVAGVLNIIPDTKFTGLKAQVQTGITERGDGRQISLGVAGGTRFAQDRGSFVASFEYEKDDAITDCYQRDWCKLEYGNLSITPAGTGGLPGRNILPNVHNSTAAPGGLITTTSLRGIQFLGGQATTNYVFGTPISAQTMVGGSGAGDYYLYKQSPISMPVKRYVGYAYADFALSDSIKLFASANYGHLNSQTRVRQVDTGTLTVFAANPFLPTSVRTAAALAGITSFRVGRLNEDINPQVLNSTEMYQFTGGLKGSFGNGWKWDASYQYGRSELTVTNTRSRISANFNRAIDAVADPLNPAQTICRSTITNRSDGCVPFNLFGSNQYSAAAFGYSFGTGVVTTTVIERSAAANISGSPFSTWAGPVSIAAGAEYRTDKIIGGADALSQAFAFAQGNGQLYSGKIEVAEGYLEAIVPLAKELPFAYNIELNGAIRRTHYNTSGSITTYKLGGVYEPVAGLRARITKSRDIRAPNATELFAGSTQAAAQIQDTVGPGNPNGSNIFSSIVINQNSNSSLTPERADTWTAGVVLQPRRFLRGLTLSVDYFDISLKGAIGRLGPQNILNRCAAGATEFCVLISRDAQGTLASVSDTYLNFGSIKMRGLDIEASYSLPVSELGLASSGKLGFQVFASHAINLTTTDSAGSVDRAGMLGLIGTLLAGPKWTVDGTISYDSDSFSIGLQNRYIAGGKYDVTLVGPEDPGYAVTLANSINTNRVAGRVYQNLSVSFRTKTSSGVKFEWYGAINNLFDRDPPPSPSAASPTAPAYFDTIGRAFRVGVRVKI